jgi:hypothetical protein
LGTFLDGLAAFGAGLQRDIEDFAQEIGLDLDSLDELHNWKWDDLQTLGLTDVDKLAGWYNVNPADLKRLLDDIGRANMFEKPMSGLQMLWTAICLVAAVIMFGAGCSLFSAAMKTFAGIGH